MDCRSHCHGSQCSGLDVADQHQHLPLHIACAFGASREVVDLLIDRHGDPFGGLDAADEHGFIPLHYAAYYGKTSLETFQLVLETFPAGAGIFNSYGRLPLHFACRDSRFSAIIGRLLEIVPFSVLSMYTNNDVVWFPYKIASSAAQPAEVLELLARKQDEAVRLVRDGVRDASGLPDLVVSTICSFALPKIFSPIEGEMTW